MSNKCCPLLVFLTTSDVDCSHIVGYNLKSISVNSLIYINYILYNKLYNVCVCVYNE